MVLNAGLSFLWMSSNLATASRRSSSSTSSTGSGGVNTPAVRSSGFSALTFNLKSSNSGSLGLCGPVMIPFTPPRLYFSFLAISAWLHPDLLASSINSRFRAFKINVMWHYIYLLTCNVQLRKMTLQYGIGHQKQARNHARKSFEDVLGERLFGHQSCSEVQTLSVTRLPRCQRSRFVS